MKISSIICTRNRAKYLRQAIHSLTAQDLPVADYEIIVVDNDSTDSTRQIVNELAGTTPNLRYVYEKNPGLSNARNRGIQEAIAPVVTFLDDDALAAPSWLTAILNTFDTHPQPACVGGPVEPWWEIPRPQWFPESFIGCHSRYYGARARWYDYPAEHPIGCNMAFLKERVLEVGGFNAALENYNDETELISRLVAIGGKLKYEPLATVRHLLGKERLGLRWQMRRHYQEGKSLALAATLKHPLPVARRIPELGTNLFSITKRTARLFVSWTPMRERVQKLAHLSTLIGKTVYLTKSLRER
ncbi:MAG: glycosyltransferase family 2 protein [Chthoniobacterales bacterium]